jgi:signal transduction histidine kinase
LGHGIDPEIESRLFSAFFTINSDGAGMRLSIYRSIIETHGERGWASSGAEAGATFQFASLLHGKELM